MSDLELVTPYRFAILNSTKPTKFLENDNFMALWFIPKDENQESFYYGEYPKTREGVESAKLDAADYGMSEVRINCWIPYLEAC